MYTDVCVTGKYNSFALNYFKQAKIDIDFREQDSEILSNAKPDFIAFNYYSNFAVKYVEPKFEYRNKKDLINKPDLMLQECLKV